MAFTQKTPFFLVWNPRRSTPPRKKHLTVDAAETEAQRMADLFPGQKFHVVVALGYCFTAPPPKEQP